MNDVVAGQTPDKTIEGDIREEFKKPEPPSDFDDEVNFLAYAVQLFQDDLEYDRFNREAAIEDAKFMVGDQWDEAIKQRRIDAQKPTLTFNRLPAFVAQVIGNRRLSETEIKITADDAQYDKTAKIREGLVRSIQKNSRAQIAFNKSFENEVITGIGNFKLELEYAHDDVFEQDIKINAVENAFSIVWDRESSEPSGRDAHHVFEVELMTERNFKQEWPDAISGEPSTASDLLGIDVTADWRPEGQVRVVNFWRMRSKKRILALLSPEQVMDAEGNLDEEVINEIGEQVEDVTDLELADFQDRIVSNSEGLPLIREVDVKYAQLYVLTATDLLEGPYDLPISRVPIFRVPGWDINVGETRVRFGLIRFLKDPQRLHNYWRSIIAEKLMLTPKGNWIATEAAVQGREEEWRNSHLSDDPLLIYNEEGMPPVRVAPSQIENGLIEQSNMAAQDLKEISNMHEANLGQRSNEVSGKAILARQRVGETGTVIYQDNQDYAQEECGRTINELIPFVYDTRRTIKIMGEEGQELPPVLINDTTSKTSYDMTAGKYSVSSVTGPSYVTKRVEAQEAMLAMVNSMPQTMAVAVDKIVEAQDWPGKQGIVDRLRTQLPPGVLSEKDLTDDQKAAQQQTAEREAIEADKANQMFTAELRERNARAEQAEAQAIKSMADASVVAAKMNIEEFKAITAASSEEVKQIMEAMRAFGFMELQNEAERAAQQPVSPQPQQL